MKRSLRLAVGIATLALVAIVSINDAAAQSNAPVSYWYSAQAQTYTFTDGIQRYTPATQTRTYVPQNYNVYRPQPQLQNWPTSQFSPVLGLNFAPQRQTFPTPQRQTFQTQTPQRQALQPQTYRSPYVQQPVNKSPTFPPASAPSGTGCQPGGT